MIGSGPCGAGDRDTITGDRQSIALQTLVMTYHRHIRFLMRRPHVSAPPPNCDMIDGFPPVTRRRGRSRALLAAALLLASAGQAAALSVAAQSSGPAKPATEGDYDRCLAMTHTDPAAALTTAEDWRSAGGGFPADHCAAVALIQLKRYGEAAQRLEALAGAMMASDPALRADALEQAGQAWLLANKPDQAKAAIDAALAFKHDDPDLLIDRAQTYAEVGKFREAIDDLNRAIDQAPYRADALVFRASAYRRLPDGLDLALQDVEHALKLAPDMPPGLLERGNIRALKGDMAGAKADWRRVEKLAPHSPEATAARNNLARVGEASDKATTAPPDRN